MEPSVSKIFFSVIIPSYNRAGIITETIQSVLQQDFTDFEILLIDDGSTDQTNEVVSEIKDERLHYFFQENKERSAARNAGIRLAKGKYICFLDSDDRYENNHLSSFFQFIQNQEASVAMYFCDHHCVQNGKQTEALIPEFDPSNAAFYFLYNPVIPARVCIHHEILQKYTFDERIVIVEDLVLWVRIALHYPVYHLRKKTVLYHLHESNSVNIANNAFGTRLHGLQIFFEDEEIKSAVPASARRNLISDCHFGIARHLEYKRKFFPMLSELFLSFLYKPFHPQNKSKLYMIYRFIFSSGNR
jgi:glycosyltransferase involved in cell wall biosynthesis